MRTIKHIAALFGLAILISSFSACAGGKRNDGMYAFQEETPFNIGKAHSQEWVAGVQAGGSGVQVEIEILAIQEGVEIKDIYFRKKKQKAVNDHYHIDIYKVNMKKEMGRDITMDSDPVKESKNTAPEAFPFSLDENTAVISYLYQGELYFAEVPNMEVKPLLAYPGGNPNDEN